MSTRQPRTVVLFGDSNTHGTVPMTSFADRRRFAPGVRWPGVLRGLLPADVALIEEGQPGRTTVHDDPIEGAHRNGLSALPMVLETHRPVDVLVILLGTNDMKARFPGPAEDVALGLGKLAETARRPGAGRAGGAPRLLLVAPPPLRETGCLAAIFAGGAAKSAGLAPLLAGVAAAQGAAFLDAGAHIAVSDIDGIHFDAAAHAALGRALAPAVMALLPEEDATC